jgi:hypothetical protein
MANMAATRGFESEKISDARRFASRHDGFHHAMKIHRQSDLKVRLAASALYFDRSTILGLYLMILGLIAAPVTGKPLKVFILAGQSNMQGHASLSTFDSLADDPKTAPLLKEMRDTSGKPRVAGKVWISSIG